MGFFPLDRHARRGSVSLDVMRHSIEQLRESFMPMSWRVIIAVASSARRVCFQMVSQASHFAHNIAPQSERHARDPQVGQANTLTHNKTLDTTAGSPVIREPLCCSSVMVVRRRVSAFRSAAARLARFEPFPVSLRAGQHFARRCSSPRRRASDRSTRRLRSTVAAL